MTVSATGESSWSRQMTLSEIWRHQVKDTSMKTNTEIVRLRGLQKVLTSSDELNAWSMFLIRRMFTNREVRL